MSNDNHKTSRRRMFDLFRRKPEATGKPSHKTPTAVVIKDDSAALTRMSSKGVDSFIAGLNSNYSSHRKDVKR